MIVLDKENDFMMIRQHDHAQLSGEMVWHWQNHFLLRSKLREEADWAISQHDRAWIALDENPKWNEQKQRPYSFIDYPLEEKLAAYQRGIEEVASQSLYAGILCSRHYESFLSEDDDNALIRQFVKEEKKRQEDLFEAMDMDVPRDIFDLHFRRLQFCDDLSLYVTMQEGGTPKEKEVSWFKNGFRQSFDFAPDGMIAHWVDESHVSIDPFPFQAPFEVKVPYKMVAKQAIQEKGISPAFHEAKTGHKTIHFVPKEG